MDLSKLKSLGNKVIHSSGSLVIGIIVLLLLILFNSYWYIYGDKLIKQGPRDLPPQISFFQSIFYSPQVSEYLIEADEWGGGWGDSEVKTPLDNHDIKALRNQPIVTLPVGGKYSFTPNIGVESYSGVELSVAPDGMLFDDGSIKWTPGENQTGTSNVAIRFVDEKDSLYEFSYTMIVTEDYFPLGTNRRGQSLSGLIIAGSKWSLIPGLIAASIAIFFGVFMGAISAFYRENLDRYFTFLSDIIESIPALIIIFIIAAATQFNMYYIMVGVGIVLLPSVQNIIRSNTLQFVENQFVESSAEIGFKNKTILWREIIWYNCKSDIISLITYCFAFSILIEVTISYLNLGVQAPEISWGLLLREGRGALFSEEYWMTIFPSFVITISILGFILLGSGLKQEFDPKLK